MQSDHSYYYQCKGHYSYEGHWFVETYEPNK
jgi:hypothetical protein